ncbi:DUF3043 domain-containing protein [Agreia pratensis]|nr:DUF3043 domain-containing protein [Agreia pratensis]
MPRTTRCRSLSSEYVAPVFSVIEVNFILLHFSARTYIVAKDKAPALDAPRDAQFDDAPISGKGHATPTRKEREAANKRPLVAGDNKEARKASRAKLQESRDRARVGMANGEEKFLPLRDKGPQRRYVRDYVDARFSLGEVMIPVMFAVILATLVPNPTVQTALMLALYAFVVLVVVDSLLLGWLVTRKLKAKFGDSKVEKGVRWYAAMRALQLRPLRLPKPQVKRGKYPV